MEFEYLVFPSAAGWHVVLRDGAFRGDFRDFVSAERRARWLAARASVKGYDSSIRLLDKTGALVGVWRAEQYAAAAPASIDPQRLVA